jgi:hypothetical protein
MKRENEEKSPKIWSYKKFFLFLQNKLKENKRKKGHSAQKTSKKRKRTEHIRAPERIGPLDPI